MATAVDDVNWVSDYVVSFLKSPTCFLPLAQFLDERCSIFDDCEENKLDYTACHNDFKRLVLDLFASHLVEVSVTPEQFDQFCQTGLAENSQLHRTLVEQLLSVDDFLTFKAMMTKQNADLDLEATVTVDDALGSPTAWRVAQSLVAETIGQAADIDEDFEDDWQAYEDRHLKDAIAASQADVDCQEANLRCEEAELEQAIALSLQLEEERLQMATTGGVSEVALPPTAGFTSAPLQPLILKPKAAEPIMPRILKVASIKPTVVPAAAGFTSAPLIHVLRSPCVEEPTSAATPTQVDVPAFAPRARAFAPITKADLEDCRRRISLQQCRQRAERILVAPPTSNAANTPVMLNPAATAALPMQSPSEDERRARTEHLKKQRERLLAKRTRDRDAKMDEFNYRRAHGRVDAAVQVASSPPDDRFAAGRRLVAELTPGAVVSSAIARPLPDAAAAAEQMRHALTLQLRQTLVRSVDNSDSATLSDRLNQLEAMREV